MKRRNQWMLHLITATFLLASVAILVNTFFISIIGYHFNSEADLKKFAANVSTQVKTLQAKRGLIVDRNGEVIAQDLESYTLYAIVDPNRPSYQNQPSYVVDQEATAQALSTVLNASSDYILNLLQKASYQTEFGLYGSHLSLETKQQIEALNLPGLGFIKQYSRNYPLDVFASNLIGFVAQDETTQDVIGKMGLEQTYESELAGLDGQSESVVDRYGYVLPGYPQKTTAQVDGKTITLTLDRSLQEQLESSFKITQETFGATEMFGGIMEVETGRLLALGQSPSFDPNLMNVTEFKNYATQYVYEPGSTMKSFTYAAAIDTGVYDGQATFNSSPFLVSINKNGDPYRNSGSGLVIGSIRNAHNKSWGTIDYDTGYAFSSNVGIASLLTTRLDLDTFQQYLIRFGFNDSVKVDGLSESMGNINFSWPYEKLTVGFGQGITVNMLQLMQAYTAIFNDGTMVKPYLVESIVDPLTHVSSYQAKVTTIGQPIKAETAQAVQKLMYKVTQSTPVAGTGRAYNVDEVDILAKTGTAQIYVDGQYSDTEFLYSVMIGLPADHPKVMVYYAFRAPATLNAHFKTEAVQQLLHQVSLVYNLRKDAPTSSATLRPVSIEPFTLPSYINHSLTYVLNDLSTKTTNITQLGNGLSVIDQYPQAQNEILPSQRIFLLTSRDVHTLIDLSGLSQKDVIAYFNLIGHAVTFVGEGNVVSQSLPPDSELQSDSVVEVTLG